MNPTKPNVIVIEISLDVIIRLICYCELVIGAVEERLSSPIADPATWMGELASS